MTCWKGRWLIAVAAIHTLFAIVFFRPHLADIVARGVYDTVGEDPMTGAVVWFVLFGAVLFIAGLAIHHLERVSPQMPRSLGFSLLALVGLGVVLMPASGFWLALPVGIALVVRRPARQAA